VTGQRNRKDETFHICRRIPHQIMEEEHENESQVTAILRIKPSAEGEESSLQSIWSINEAQRTIGINSFFAKRSKKSQIEYLFGKHDFSL
jgi:hypothetical protein